MDWIRKNKIELIMLSILCLIVTIFRYFQLSDQSIHFIDTDDHIRMLSLREFFVHHDLNNHIISRGNYPHGINLHWTRLYDFVLMIPAYCFQNLAGSLEKALEYVGFWIAPIFRVLSVMVLYKIYSSVVQKKTAFLIAAIFIATPFVIGYFSFGRPDHHAFLMFLTLIYLASLVSLLNATKFPAVKEYAQVIISITLCVWASPETLIPIITSLGCLFLYYFNDLRRLKGLYMISLISAACIGTIAFIPGKPLNSDFLLFMCAIWAFAPYSLSRPGGFKSKYLQYWHLVCMVVVLGIFSFIGPVEYDKISIVHASIFMYMALFFAINMQLIGKRDHKFDSALWAVTIGIVFLSLYPLFLKGMEGEISPYVKKIWFSKVEELQSPLKSNELAEIFIANTLISVVAMIIKARSLKRKDSESITAIWMVVIACAFVYTVLSCFAFRMLPCATLFTIPVVVDVCMESKLVSSLHRWIRILLAIFFTSMFAYPVSLLVSDNVKTDNKVGIKGINNKEVCEFLDGLSSTPVVFMENCNLGTKILYYTKHMTLAVPYHRSTQGIVSTYNCLNIPYKKSRVKRILTKTKTKFIIVPKKYDEKKDNLATRIATRKYPDFLTRVENTPESCKDIIIMKVDFDKADSKSEESVIWSD